MYIARKGKLKIRLRLRRDAGRYSRFELKRNIQEATQYNYHRNSIGHQTRVLLQLQPSLIISILVVRLIQIEVFPFPLEKYISRCY